MPTANEKLAAALDELRRLQADGSRVFASEQLTRTSRERLVKHGFLQQVMKGWLMSASPTALPGGDTTPWFASLWEFCRRYCEARFGAEWHLSPEQSLLMHAANTTIPKQVIIHSPQANNNRIDLLFGTSFFALKAKQLPPAHDLELKDGLRIYRLAAALTRVNEDFFVRYPIETQVIASAIQEPSRLLARLLEGGHSTIAGRLAGLFRRLGRTEIADEIVTTMKAADHVVREVDPLEPGRVVYVPRPATPRVVGRLQALWAAAREVVLAELPKARAPVEHDERLHMLEGVYKLDAYHSLSIEGYQVTPELIERVATGAWDLEKVAADRDSKAALAARGYWLAFERVRDDVKRILASNNAPQVVRAAHRDWYRELFSPHVAAGLIDAKLLAGYRNGPVFIRGSQHVPPRWEVVPEAMAAVFDLVAGEAEAAVRAVLGHWLVGYVHPFPDGNGRVARFVMNTLLAAGGYPWTIIQVDDRDEYLATLETASVTSDVRPFARFVSRQMQRTGALIARSARAR
jgi:Fic family protein